MTHQTFHCGTVGRSEFSVHLWVFVDLSLECLSLERLKRELLKYVFSVFFRLWEINLKANQVRLNRSNQRL